MAKEKIKVYTYTRVSTAMQIDGYSLDAQKSRMKAFAEFNDYEIAHEYEDAGKSGKSIEGRTQFNQMMEDIKTGKDGVSFVLVFKLSRFGRNAADVLSTLQVMQDFGVNLICVEDGIDSSKDAGKLMISVLSAVAEIERENIRVQTMEGRIQKAREGKWNGGFAPYGYKLVDGKLEINEEEAPAIRTIYEQQKYMYDNRTHSVPDRIVSVSQPFVRPIVRGKAGKPVEFGAKLDISVVDGWTRLECCSFDAYNEAGNLLEMTERFREREGHYPSRILADKIYRNRENLSYCKEHGIRLSGPALGRPRKGEIRDKAQDYRDECERVEVERRFSLAKRKCGMGLVTAKLRETAAHVIAMSILVLNLRKIQCAFLQFLTYLLAVFPSKEEWAIVQ